MERFYCKIIILYFILYLFFKLFKLNCLEGCESGVEYKSELLPYLLFITHIEGAWWEGLRMKNIVLSSKIHKCSKLQLDWMTGSGLNIW